MTEFVQYINIEYRRTKFRGPNKKGPYFEENGAEEPDEERPGAEWPGVEVPDPEIPSTEDGIQKVPTSCSIRCPMLSEIESTQHTFYTCQIYSIIIITIL